MIDLATIVLHQPRQMPSIQSPPFFPTKEWVGEWSFSSGRESSTPTLSLSDISIATGILEGLGQKRPFPQIDHHLLEWEEENRAAPSTCIWITIIRNKRRSKFSGPNHRDLIGKFLLCTFWSFTSSSERGGKEFFGVVEEIINSRLSVFIVKGGSK